MQQQPTNQPAPCPVCGAQPAYRIWGKTMGYGGVLLASKKHPFNGSPAKPLVCTVCGYVQLFVDPNDFRD
jgi:rubrerythrin